MLLHGDLGPGNVVLSERGWLAIDPYPVLGDRAFDVKQVLSLRDLRDAREQVAFFADRLALDARRIAGWTFRAVCMSRCGPGRSATLWNSANTSTVRNSSHRSAWCSKAQGSRRCGVSLGQVATRLVVRRQS